MTNTTTCQWIGDTYTRLKPSCTHTALQGKSYCAEHYPLVYSVGSAVRRKKDARRAQAVWDLESEFNAAVQELVDEGYDLNEERWAPEVVEED